MPTTRDRILTATNELFRRNGFNGTSIKQITIAAKVPMGSLYHFFPQGKDQLAREAIETSGPAYQQLLQMIADEAVTFCVPGRYQVDKLDPGCFSITIDIQSAASLYSQALIVWQHRGDGGGAVITR